MLCDECGRSEARYHFHSQGDEPSRHLCRECALEQGFLDAATDKALAPEEGLEKQDSPDGRVSPDSPSFQRLMDELSRLENILYTKEKQLECPQCHKTLRHIKEDNKAGCAECYRTFRPEMVAILEENSEIPHHSGKVPQGLADIKKVLYDLNQLDEELQAAVNREDYERAAEIRDKIHHLQEAL